MDMSYKKDMRTERIEEITLTASDFIEEKLLGALRDAMVKGHTVIAFMTDDGCEGFNIVEGGHQVTAQEYEREREEEYGQCEGEPVDPDDDELWF